MTAHTHSDDLAINAAQARVRDNLEARARSCMEEAIKRPSTGAIRVVTQALLALHHQYLAKLEQLSDCQGERLPQSPTTAADWAAIGGAQSDFGRNPAPIREAPNGERLPLPRNTP